MRTKRLGKILITAAAAVLVATWTSPAAQASGKVGVRSARSGVRPRPTTPAVTTKVGGSEYREVTQTFKYGRFVRSYTAWWPTSSTKKLSIVVMLAGSGVTPQFEAKRDNLLYTLRNAVVVYPAEYQGHWDAIHCCGVPAEQKVNDVGFVEEVIHRVEKSPLVQPTVYLGGYSNGGKLAELLACDQPTLFRAVATYGAMPTFNCARWRPLAELVLVGTADPEVTIGPGGTQVVEGGFPEPKVTTFMAWRRKANSCGQDSRTSHQGGLTLTNWTSCARGAVTEGLFAGQTHRWPYSSGQTPGAAVVISDWFSSQGL